MDWRSPWAGQSGPNRRRLRHLAACAEALQAPLVSEHLAFVRAGGRDSGHLLPVPRTGDALEVVCANIAEAQARLPVPLALENIATLIEWPESELSEADFLTEVVARTGVSLLVDVANLYANARNHGTDPLVVLDRLPLDHLAYVHVAGGVDRDDGFYRDTHRHTVPPPVFGFSPSFGLAGTPRACSSSGTGASPRRRSSMPSSGR